MRRFVLLLLLSVCAVLVGSTAQARHLSGGQELWVARFDGPLHSFDVPTDVVASADGSRVFVVGGIGSPDGSRGYAAAAYDSATGVRLWLRRLDGVSDGATSAAASPDGSRLFVTGWTIVPGKGWTLTTVCYDAASGDRIWLKRFVEPGYTQNSGSSIAVSPDGQRVFVAGSIGRDIDRSHEFITIAYNASTGVRQWVRRHSDRDSPSGPTPATLALSPNGTRVFVSAPRRSPDDGNPTQDIATFAYDASSEALLWQRSYTAEIGFDEAELAVSPDGARLFVSDTRVTNGDAAYVTIAYAAATGKTLWVRAVSGPSGTDDLAKGIAISPDGSRIVVTGFGTGVGGSVTVAYDAVTGEKLWQRAQQGFNPSGVQFAPDGTQVYLTGGTGTDAVTLASDPATGDVDWASDYHPPDGSAGGYGVAVAPDSTRVYVIGTVFTSSTQNDWLTIAYSAN